MNKVRPTWYDRFALSLFPMYGLRRLQAKSAMAYYEASRPSKIHKRLNNRGESPDSRNEGALSSLRNQARFLDDNHDIAAGVLTVLVNKTIGTGIRVEPQVKRADGTPHDDMNKEIMRLHDDWIKRPEVTGSMHWYEAQRLAARSLFRDGEVFAQNLIGPVSRLNHGTVVPFSIELMESDLCPETMYDKRRNITQGIEKNQWGAPRRYFFYKTHPGDTLPHVNFDQTTKSIPAGRVTHLKLVKRIRQTRGVTCLVTVLDRLDDIKDYEESERVAARIAAAMAGFIRKGSPDMYIPPAVGDDDDLRDMRFTPGMIFDDLEMGEEVGTIAHSRPNAQLLDYRNSMMKAVAMGTNTSYSSIARDYSGTYSAQRQELVEQEGSYAVVSDYMIQHMIRPIYEAFVLTWRASQGPLLFPDIDQSTLLDAHFQGPAVPWIDPKKEIEADILQIKNGITSRSMIQRRRGMNPQQVREQIAAEKEADSQLGLSFDEPEPEEPDTNEDTDTETENEVV